MDGELAYAIDCKELVRIYRSSEGVEVQALQGLSLRIVEGDVVALVGASGSGKSTLLAILAGLDRPDAGSVAVAGFDLTNLSNKERVRYRRDAVGFIRQQVERNLLPYLTVRQNIELPLLLAGRRQRDRRVTELIQTLELTTHADSRPDQLSGGQQQRAAIGVALANAPAVILADEPTGELDEEASEDILEVIRSVSERFGVTALIVTHDPAVSNHVHRSVRIRDGRASSEVRRTVDYRTPESFVVIDAQGRLQLPSEYVEALDLHDLVRLTMPSDFVRVEATSQPHRADRDQSAGEK